MAGRGRMLVVRLAPLEAVLLSFALVVAVPSISAQQQATVPGGTVDAFNVAGDVRLRASDEAFGRVRVELHPSGGLLERRRVRLLARFGAAAVAFPAREFGRGAATPPAALPITADWRFGEGLRITDTLRFSARGPSVGAELRVIVPLGHCVTAHIFFGAIHVDGVAVAPSTAGRIERRTVLNRGGKLEILGVDERRQHCPD